MTSSRSQVIAEVQHVPQPHPLSQSGRGGEGALLPVLTGTGSKTARTHRARRVVGVRGGEGRMSPRPRGAGGRGQLRV